MRERLMATVSGGFGILAGLLATLGLYGVIAYMVARRRKEIGMQILIGADRTNVIRLVLREAILLLSIGLVAGTVLSWWTSKGAATLLLGLEPNDATTLASACALLTAVTLIAGYLPPGTPPTSTRRWRFAMNSALPAQASDESGRTPLIGQQSSST